MFFKPSRKVKRSSFFKFFIYISLELGEDAIVQSHLAALYDNLLEQNLLQLVLPYSRIQIAFISAKIGLSLHDIELKLSQMILDNVLNAIIDHSTACLLLTSGAVKADSSFGLIQNCFNNMDSIIESLTVKSKSI